MKMKPSGPHQDAGRVFGETRQFIEKGRVKEARTILLQQEACATLPFSPEEEAEAAILWAWLLYKENSYTEAIVKARQAFNGYRLSTDHIGLAESLYLLGLLHALTGELWQAEKSLLDALANYRRVSDLNGLSKTYSELARLSFIRSDLKSAEQYLLESLEAARAGADSVGEGRAWGNLGRVYFISGRWEEAEKSLRLALVVNRVTNAFASQARNQLSLAYLYLCQGRWEECEQEFLEAERKIAAENLEREKAILHEYRGELCFWKKDWVRAEEEYRSSLQIGERLAPQSGLVSQVERRWAELLLAQGRPGAALGRAQAALDLARILGEKEEVVASLRVLALAFSETGEVEQSQHYLEQAFQFIPPGVLPLEEARLKILAIGLLADAEEAPAAQYLKELGSLVSTLKTSPILSESFLWCANKLMRSGNLPRLELVLEFLKETSGKGYVGLRKEQQEFLARLTVELCEKKLAKAFSLENNFSLFLNWGKAGSLQEKLADLAGKLRLQDSQIYGISKGSWIFLAGTGPDPAGADEIHFEPELPHLTLSPSTDEPAVLLLPLEVENERLGVLRLLRTGPPFSQEELNLAAASAPLFALELSHQGKKDLVLENQRLLATLEAKCAFPNIITRSKSFISLLDAAARVKDSDLSVLLMGETGTGKDLLAKTIHFQSVRRDGRFVSVNCAALPETLLESELFGHRKGAFTGADRDKPGLFEEADEGTFFLDEVSEIPLSMQAKLLRVLEEKEVVRLGETRPRKVNVRLISAGNKDLKELTEKGLFRQDLYFRLTPFTLRLPPLRERKEDIPLLLDYFAGQYGGDKKLGFEPAAFEILSSYDWPGNVRELENEIRKLSVVVGESGYIASELLSSKFFGSEEKGLPPPNGNGFSLYDHLAESEKRHICRAMAETGWVKKRAAELLKIPESTLRLKLKGYGIKPAS